MSSCNLCECHEVEGIHDHVTAAEEEVAEAGVDGRFEAIRRSENGIGAILCVTVVDVVNDAAREGTGAAAAVFGVAWDYRWVIRCNRWDLIGFRLAVVTTHQGACAAKMQRADVGSDREE